LHDWALHLALGRGFAACNAGGELIGTTLWWPWGNAFGTIGLVVVRDDAKGRGLGRLLMQSAIGDAGARTLGLVATTAGLRLYQSLGFADIGGIEQWQGTISGTAALAELAASSAADVTLRPLVAGDLPAARTLDAAALGAPRNELIDTVWQTSRTGVAALQGGQLTGFALLRASGHGTTIGPLVAADESLATRIAAKAIETAAAAAANGIVRFDIPASARLLARQLEQAGLRCVDRVTLMRRGDPLPADPRMQRFGLASQAFG
jgi:predicted N-acetyltransferase YhbS